MAQDAPFVEALGVMDQLLASFEDHSDADAILDVQRMVEEAATTAHEREAAVAQSIKALCQRTSDLEREADYEQRRAAHAEAVAATRQRSDAERQAGDVLAARLAELESALASVDEQGAALQAARRELRRRETEEAPRKVHQISLYAHITRLAFSFSGGGGGGEGGASLASASASALQRGTVTDAKTGEVRSVEVDLRAPSEGGRETSFARANRVWGQL